MLGQDVGLQDQLIHDDDPGVASLHDIVANNIRAERARRRWTQSGLAERLGWPRTSIYDVESGKRRLSLDDLAALCEAFEVPLVELCHGADSAQLRALGILQ